MIKAKIVLGQIVFLVKLKNKKISSIRMSLIKSFKEKANQHLKRKKKTFLKISALRSIFFLPRLNGPFPSLFVYSI